MVRGGLLLVVIAALFGFASPARGASMPCWQRLVQDWADGRIEASYPVGCYRQALARLPEDLRVYSSAGEDIQAALARKISRVGSGARALAVSPQSIAHAGSSAGFPASAVIVAAIVGGALMGLVALPAARARRTRR